jgi:transmembrane sensor
MSQRRWGEAVGGDADEAKVARMWAGIGVRRAARARRAGVARVLVVVAAAAIVVLVAWTMRKPGPLAMHDGSAVHTWSVPAGGVANVVELDDGSAITLSAAASIDPVESTGERFCVLLREGSAHFSVQPGGPRRWIVEAGVATVEVVGTVFDVARDASGVRVSVERGVVVVRGERVPNHVHRLVAHESMMVAAEIAKIDETAPPPPPVVSSALPVVVSPTASASVPPTLDALLEDADRARREGRTQEALSLLARVAASHDDARAALASFTRAKLELREPVDLAGATQDLERAIARGLPAPLDDEARGRLVDVYTRTGRNDDARRVAAEMRAKTNPP